MSEEPCAARENYQPWLAAMARYIDEIKLSFSPEYSSPRLTEIEIELRALDARIHGCVCSKCCALRAATRMKRKSANV